MTPRATLPGVDELFGSAKPKEGEQVLVPLDRLVPATDNPRRDLGDVASLAASISAVGLLEPLIVTQDPAGSAYLVVAGHRRLAAAKGDPLNERHVKILSAAERSEDAESEAVAVCSRHLTKLTEPEAKRVLEYLAQRFVVDAS